MAKWVESGSYRQILAGEYPLRSTDREASFVDEAKEAARAYKQSFDETTDPLLRTLRDLAGNLASTGAEAGQSLWDRLGRRGGGSAAGD
jgi:hypothetical protein